MLPFWIYPACLATALAYAAVGMGGGSAYLAFLALAGFESDAVRVTVLSLNLVVAGGGFLIFRRAGHFQPRLLVPFAVTSIPAAFLGAIIPVPTLAFRILLAIVLLFAAARMLLWDQSLLKPRKLSWSQAWRYGPPVGAVLGLLAGLVGIGGGIFLAPLLILLGWADSKRAAAVAAGFIVLNSLAGLIAHTARGSFLPLWALPLLVVVLVGGQIGARAGAFKMSTRTLRRFFGAFILIVVLNLAWKIAAPLLQS